MGAHRKLRVIFIAAAVLFLPLAGCGSNASHETPAPTGGPTAGVLRLVETDQPDNLNPLIASQPIALELSYLTYSFFFDVDDRSRLVPDVALEVPTVPNGGISPDGKTITYHLRKGVRWQDGQPLTSRDVVFTYHAIVNPRNNVQGLLGYEDIADVVAPDDYTVVVHMKRVDSPIVTLFMCLDGDYPILPAHLLATYPDLNHAAYNDKPIGSGPFSVVDWVRGDHITFAANPDYWRGPPKLDKIVVSFVGSNAQIVDRLRTGQADAWFNSDPTLYPELTQLGGIGVTIAPDNNFGHLDFNLRDPLLQDVRVRRAIELAIDRRKIVEEATHDVYQTTDSDQPFTSWAYDRRVPHPAYDPNAATALLRSAGWHRGPDGVLANGKGRIELQLAFLEGNSLDKQVADILKGDLAAVGIQIDERPYPEERFLSSLQSGGVVYNGRYQLAMFEWGVGLDPDDSWLYACDQQPPQGENSTFWCDPKVDAAERGARATFDVATRRSDYAVIQSEIADQVPMIFLYAQRRADVYSTRLVGFRPAPTFAYWNAWRWEMR